MRNVVDHSPGVDPVERLPPQLQKHCNQGNFRPSLYVELVKLSFVVNG